MGLLCKAASTQHAKFAHNAYRELGVHYGGGKHAILVKYPQTFGKVRLTRFTYQAVNPLKLLVLPDRPRTPDPLQSRHRSRQNLHPRPLPTHFSQPPSPHCPLGRRRLRSLLLHGPILRAAHPMSTHPSGLGSHRAKSDVHPR